MANLATLVARKGMVLLRTVLAVGLIALASTVVVGFAAQDDAALTKAVDEYIEVCQSQYDKGLYSTAKDGLLEAKSEYSSDMTEAQKSRINSMLERVNQAIEARTRVSEMLENGKKAVNSKDYSQGLEMLNQVVSDKYASKAQVEEAKSVLESAEESMQKVEEQMESLFDESVSLYKDGLLREAMQGFQKVSRSGVDVSNWFGRDSEYYIAKIKEAMDAGSNAEQTAASKQTEQASAEQKKQENASEGTAKQEAMELFKQSVEEYKAGNYEAAKDGFEAVADSGYDIKNFWGRDSEYFLQKISDKSKELAEEAEKAEEEARMAEEKKAREKEEAEQKAREEAMDKLFRESVEQYRGGNFDAAEEGFQLVEKSEFNPKYWGKDSSDFLARIEKARKAKADKAAEAAAEKQTAEKQTAEKKAEKAQQAKQEKPDISAEAKASEQKKSPEAKEDSYLRVLSEKRNRQRDYTRAIVNDAVTKANQYLGDEQFAKAREALSVAYANIEKTKMLLGDELYSEYKTRLDSLSTKIDNLQQEARIESAKIEREQTEELEKEIRRDMERQRQQAVKDYMENAMAFQREQRYEEALAQLEALLAIDPLNSMALLQKQTLEQTISWRKQIEVQNKMHREEIETLIKADEASIPYADDMTFPSNWKEIVKKREQRESDGMSKENLDVYRLLDQKVDLSALYEDMPFGEALEVLRNSTNPPLTIIVLWRDLDENAFIDQTTPINLTIPAPVKVKTALELLLDSVAGGLAELSYVVKDGIIQIATMGSLPDKMVTKRYDVRELLGETANFSFEMDVSNYGQSEGRTAGGGGGGGDDYESDDDDQQEDTRDSLTQRASTRAQSIVNLIQETVAPETWYDAGGDGSITTFQNNVLVIRQTLEQHEKIKELIDELRLTLGEQVAIEARFLTVTENFLEQIGIDLDMVINPDDSNWNEIAFTQSHKSGGAPSDSGLPGSLAGAIASSMNGSYVMDDLQVSFLIEATQAHKDAKSLNAPRVAVLNGERASIRVGKETSFVSDYEFEDLSTTGDNPLVRTIADPEIDRIRDGVNLTVTPTITADKKYVILGIQTQYLKTNFDTYTVPSDTGTGTQEYPIQLPVREEARIGTRVTVPDGGTLLIGGQKLTGQKTAESGVPVLSKMPFVGPLFENRGTLKDQSILLILVKPSIILRDEQEKEAVDAMESNF
ncbi:Type IV pilus biogenesis and competence protein PilQ precursor [Sedimentisphaera cyanobacteriorum]|uniref:Type IV pilus biogenesis and competence protein PilQ n=1 Tax=Sedimentisphaera cyanobacteriorum TaxID=1940790 RepID=A0A1Q2HME2_9BACT|nr:hypothetical protein [Sedimentisphaera cyanobacteriorum]AQQ08403.1 Type IV pilus biogenesis and competence protein PilQ precursor [Sedimentisphaera cyanobacteriorum]